MSLDESGVSATVSMKRYRELLVAERHFERLEREKAKTIAQEIREVVGKARMLGRDPLVHLEAIATGYETDARANE